MFSGDRVVRFVGRDDESKVKTLPSSSLNWALAKKSFMDKVMISPSRSRRNPMLLPAMKAATGSV